mgnify:CR=1 FL=1
MWTSINQALNIIDNFVWGVPLMVLIIAGGLLLTIRLGLLQIRKLPLALKWMLQNEEGGKGEISSFSALCTALSATIGTGNIVGVATAVCAGGPGALFWMVVAAFLGMATKYSEGLLAVKYRTVAEDGHSLGGPFYYIELGMGKNFKWLAKIFAFFGVCVGLFGIGTFSQVNGISSAVHGFFDPNDAFTVKILPFLVRCHCFPDSLLLRRSCFDRRRQENCKRQPDHRSLHGSHLFCIRSDPDLLQHHQSACSICNHRNRSIFSKSDYRRCSRQHAHRNAKGCCPRHLLQ